VPLLGSTRLLSLTGAGGSGKTRLARELAERVGSRSGEVAWVDLTPLRDPELVPAQAAVALGVHERLDASTAEALVAVIGDRPLLVVLDNCEHLVDAAAELAEALLRGCPRLSLLATSREALGVPGETAWLVPPLASAEAAQLFVERARAVQPGFGLTAANTGAVAEVCRRLDGIPLAIELAAARVRALSPQQIAERLDDAFRLLSSGSRTALPRHRTLRGAIDWSHDLLAPREQVLLRRLAAFAGGFTLDAAEAVCIGGELEPEDILDGVAALVDKSLVLLEAAEDDARYRVLETVRQYGLERLESAGEREELRGRHAAWYLAAAEGDAPHLVGGAGPRQLLRLDADAGNFQAVAEWAAEQPERATIALRLGYALHWYWFARGLFREGRHQLQAALAQPAPADLPELALRRGQALIALGHIFLWQGDAAAVRPAMEEAVRLLRAERDRTSLAYALNGLGAACLVEGDPAGAAAPLREALALVRLDPPSVMHAIILYWTGRCAQMRGEFAAAREALVEAEQIGRALHHRHAIAHPVGMRAGLAAEQGELREAFELYAESLTLHHETEDRWGLAGALEGMGGVLVRVGRQDRGTRFIAAAHALRERIGTPQSPPEQAAVGAHLAAARAAMGPAFEAAWDEGRGLPPDEAVRLALADAAPRTAEYRAVAAPAAAKPTGPGEEPAPPALAVQALGPLQVTCEGRPVPAAAWGSARSRELLALLLMHPNGCTREQVGLAFWPEASAAQVRNNFHVTLHRLRRALGHPEWVVTDGERYRIDPGLRVAFDVSRFEREVGEGRRALARGEAGATAALEEALARCRGDFLDGEPAGDWHLEVRDRLRHHQVEGWMTLGAAWLAEGRPARAAEAFRQVIARDELQEPAWRQLMTSHARMGERTQALRLYQRLAEVLRRELDAEPDEETTALHERLQQGVTP
jgi:predicted ATPase/DNA-binding SARP family transcriptional activator